MTLVWNLGVEPDTLNPITSTDAYSGRIQSLVGDTLITRDNQTLAWVPQMASRWEMSPDQRQFTFFLRDGIRWHDGVPLTVEDIIFSYERIQDPKVNSPHLRVYYKDLIRVEKIRERVVRFTFREPYFKAFDFCGELPLVPKHLFKEGEDFNAHPIGRAPVGLGPYKFLVWETGKKVLLVRNEDYWGRAIGKFPEIERIRFEFIGDDAVALQVLKKGDLDYAGLRPIQWVRQTQSPAFQERFQRYEFYTPNYSFIGWNLRRPFFSDPKVRRALTLLVNREQILKKIDFGIGRIVTGPFYFGGADYDAEVPVLPYAPLEALRLIEEAGWKDHDQDGLLDKEGVPFRFEFLIPAGTKTSERLAGILKEDLRKVGIRMEIRQVEWALFTQRLNTRDFDAVVLGWGLPFEQDPYQLWHSSQVEKGSNFVGYSDPESDRLIEKARTEFDREKRAALYRELHRRIHESQPYTFLFTRPHLIALHRRFENTKIYPVGMDPLEWRVNREASL